MSKLPWHGPLFRVRGHLAERYAAALKHLCGLDCPLNTFSIDRLGWSPQLAAYLGEDYLGNEALRMAIILSPDQAESPPAKRRFSYEAALIERVYLEARPTLLGLVADEPVVVEMDNGRAFCRNATDVLNIQRVQATLDTPRKTLGQGRQLLELAEGLGQQSRLLDDNYINRMLALVKETGDPRRRPQPPELAIDVRSMWADIYGGVYILRPPANQRGATLVIAVRPDRELAELPVDSYVIDDPEALERLHKEGYLHYPPPETALQRRLADLERDALLTAGEESPASDATERRRQINRNAAARTALPSLYWELDAEQKRVATGASYEPKRLSVSARWALSAPARDAEVVGHLVARFVRYDYTLLTQHHRRSVQAEWNHYSEAKRRYLSTHIPYLVESFVRKAEG